MLRVASVPEAGEAISTSSELELLGGRRIATDVEYLDSNGDGVPDGVKITETWAVDRHGTGVFDGLERVTRVAHHVGIDGRPERVAVSRQKAFS
jgi:hypothetical protein